MLIQGQYRKLFSKPFTWGLLGLYLVLGLASAWHAPHPAASAGHDFRSHSSATAWHAAQGDDSHGPANVDCGLCRWHGFSQALATPAFPPLSLERESEWHPDAIPSPGQAPSLPCRARGPPLV